MIVTCHTRGRRIMFAGLVVVYRDRILGSRGVAMAWDMMKIEVEYEYIFCPR